MVKKTITTASLVAKANQVLAAKETTPTERLAVANLVETLLMEADAYRGFRYLTATEVPEGCEPGVVGSRNNGYITTSYPDPTRRFYNVA